MRLKSFIIASLFIHIAGGGLALYFYYYPIQLAPSVDQQIEIEKEEHELDKKTDLRETSKTKKHIETAKIKRTTLDHVKEAFRKKKKESKAGISREKTEGAGLEVKKNPDAVRVGGGLKEGSESKAGISREKTEGAGLEVKKNSDAVRVGGGLKEDPESKAGISREKTEEADLEVKKNPDAVRVGGGLKEDPESKAGISREKTEEAGLEVKKNPDAVRVGGGLKEGPGSKAGISREKTEEADLEVKKNPDAVRVGGGLKEDPESNSVFGEKPEEKALEAGNEISSSGDKIEREELLDSDEIDSFQEEIRRGEPLDSKLFEPEASFKKADSDSLSAGKIKKFSELKQKPGNPALYYPDFAKRKGMQGTVFLRFFVDENGFVEQMRLEKSSGYKDLDNFVIRRLSLYQFENKRVWVRYKQSFQLDGWEKEAFRARRNKKQN